MILTEDKTRDFFGWAGTILSMSFFISSVQPFIKLIQGKSNFENSPGHFVTLSYINCICWYIYGDMILSKQIVYCSLLGGLINFILIFIYLFFEVRKYKMDAILNGIIIIIGTYALYKCIYVNLNDDQSVGNVCLGTYLIVLICPVWLIYKVIRQKNYNLIPIISVWISLSVTISWTAYGVYSINKYIICPNMIGFILGIILIIIYAYYSKRYLNINESDEINTIGIENDNEENEKDKGDEITTITIEDELENKKKKPVKISNSQSDD